MSVYLFNFFSILVYALFLNCLPINRHNKTWFLCILLFIQFNLIAMLRGMEVGADLPGYLYYFKEFSNTNWSSLFQWRFEYGYLVFNKLLSFISSQERILMLGVAIFVYTGFFRYIFSCSKTPWLSFFLFVGLGYYTSSFNIYRQFMAMAILVNSIGFVVDRKFKQFLFCVVAASFFHITSVIFLLLYPLSKIRISWIYFFTSFCLAVIIGKVVGGIVLGILTEEAFELYAGNMISGRGYGMLFLLLIITLGGLLMRSAYSCRQEDVYYHLMIIACCLQVVSLQFSLFSRVVLYFAINMIIFIPDIICKLKKKEIRVMGLLVASILIFLYFNYLVLTDAGHSGVIPYKFMWEN